MTEPIVVLRPPVAEDDLTYANHVEFWERHLSLLWAADPDITPGICPQWRAHYAGEQAVDALWRAWEKMWFDDPGPGLASWTANLANPIHAALLVERGPFDGCDGTRHTPTAKQLPV